MPRTMCAPCRSNTPELINVTLVETIIDNIRQRILTGGEQLVSASLSPHQRGGHPHLRHPGAADGVLHAQDKQILMGGLRRFLPRNRTLVNRVWVEMNEQILNYIRGKVIEILIVGVISYMAFAMLGLRYSVLLAVAVGFGADPLHRRRGGDGTGGHGGPVPVGTDAGVHLADGGLHRYSGAHRQRAGAHPLPRRSTSIRWPSSSPCWCSAACGDSGESSSFPRHPGQGGAQRLAQARRAARHHRSTIAVSPPCRHGDRRIWQPAPQATTRPHHTSTQQKGAVGSLFICGARLRAQPETRPADH